MRPALIYRLIAALLISVATAPVELQADGESRPNVIVILADDMGLDSVSAFNEKMGMETPAIDRMAERGMSFMDAHSTSSVCTPTRYSVLTGRYNWRSRLKRGIVQKWERPLIEDERLTLPEMFKQRGYVTACIGKWHLGWNWPSKNGGTTEKLADIDFAGSITGGPNDHGFDYYFGDDVPNWPPFAWRENDRILGQLTATMEAGAMVGVSAGPAVAEWDFSAVLHEYTRRWSVFIERQAEVDAPFFLYAPMPSPHTPIAPHESFLDSSTAGAYTDFLLQTDHAVGAIIAALEESGQLDNTLVIFTCDNGTSPKAEFEALDEAGIHLNENWRGWKADAYEGGHRVPFIAHWPGRIAADTRYEHPVTLADIMATCADVIDFELPENAAEDSVSLLPVLSGDSTGTPVHDIVIHHSISGRFAVRQGRWKLILGPGSGGWSPPKDNPAITAGAPPVQLFDLAADPREQNNLYAEHPDVVEELVVALREVVEKGRSTPGPEQLNHNGRKWWPGLPWHGPRSEFELDGNKAFVIMPAGRPDNVPVPWVWYAPTLGDNLPGDAERWMFDRLYREGIAIAGVNVGESFGNPEGRAVFQQLYDELTTNRNFSLQPVLLARSRGGLMLYNWAVEHPECVGGVAGIYPVCNLASYPGLDRASGAYGMTMTELENALSENNPVERLAPLAAAGVPIRHIHGDSDVVVPLAENSALLATRYQELGGTVEVEVPEGRGHDMWPGWFQSQALTDFIIEHAR